MFENSGKLQMNNGFENYNSYGNADKIWEKLTEKFKFVNGLGIYNSWIKPLKLNRIEAGVLYIDAPTRFIKDWVNANYYEALLKLVREEHEDMIAISVTVDANLLQSKATLNEQQAATIINSNVYRLAGTTSPQVAPQNSGNEIENHLDSRYTFDNFVTGTTNKFALSAAKSVINSEEVLMENNPLYIHGKVGLGKTHLLQAVAAEFGKVKPNKKVLYLSAEKFMFRFVKALKDNNIVSFKEYFRKLDVLIVDDIQFICGKNTTQEEFIHTFNALIESGKQVVLAGDRHPNELEGLDERMKSRLNWGLVADIQTTTFELRVEILKAKAERLGVELPKNVVEFLADKITNNVRELEGALNKIVSRARLDQKDICMEFVIDSLKDFLKTSIREVTIEDIKQKVAEHCHVRMTDLVSSKRNREIARPRQIAMYLAKKYTTKSLPEIGRNFGGKDHTTVLHAIRKIEELKSNDDFVKGNLEELSKIIER